MTTGFASVEGARLYYETSGAGEPLLLIHAGVADSRMWEAQWELFAAQYQVIRYDMRGFGRTEVTAGSTFTGHDDAAALLRHLGVERAAVVGISFGGMIALDLALAYPELVRALVLGAPSVDGEPPSQTLRQFGREEAALLERGDLDGATELNLRTWVDGPQRGPGEVNALVREQVRVMQRAAFELVLPEGFDQEGLDPPAAQRLAEVAAPTLVLVGDLDLPDKVQSAQRLAEAIPGAQHTLIPGVAHMLNMERPGEFNRLVLTFLAL